MSPGFQREDRLILKEMKVWVEQFERDLTRAQMTESNLQDKYQVSMKKISIFQKIFMKTTDVCHLICLVSNYISEKSL